MTRLNGTGIRKRCDSCRKCEDVVSIDGQYFDPPTWTQIGAQSFCPDCMREVVRQLHPEVIASAERAVHSLQALMATELSLQPHDTGALVVGGDGMARRMKRCQLLAKYADQLMSIYGNVVGFRLASAGAFGLTTLIDCARSLEDLLKAEIAFSQARAVRDRRPTSRLSYTISNRDYDYGEEDISVAGPLFRLQSVAQIAQKLAQLAATRAGEVGVTPEDRVLDDAFARQDEGLGRVMAGNNDAAALQRQLLSIAQGYLEKMNEKKDQEEARPVANLGLFRDDPLNELDRLIEMKKRFEEAGRKEAVFEIEARILLVEAELRAQRNNTPVDSALALEASAKDITPKPFDGVIDAPPDADELAALARVHGAKAVRAAFPDGFPEAAQVAPWEEH